MKTVWNLIVGAQLLAASWAFGAEKTPVDYVDPFIGTGGDLGCYGHPFLKTPNLDKVPSFIVQFELQKVTAGIPDWISPEL